MVRFDVTEVVKILRKNSQYGAKAITVLKDPKYISTVHYGIPTQSLVLDLAIGRPGIPSGRLTEIVGLDSHSKSTSGAHLLAQVQLMGGIGVLFDAESGFDTKRSRTLGINPKNLITIEPPHMEGVFDLIESNALLLRKECGPEIPILFLWDSVAGISTKTEKEKGYDENTMASAAKVLAQGLRKITPLISKQRIALVFINQLKSSLKQWGPELISYGGHAIRYHASLRMQVKRTDQENDDNDLPIGIWVETKIIKNKVARPFRVAEYLVNFTSGYDRYQDLKDAALQIGVLKQKGGGWFEMGTKKIAKSKWKDYVDTELGGVRKFYADLTDVAIKQDLIKPYGVEE